MLGTTIKNTLRDHADCWNRYRRFLDLKKRVALEDKEQALATYHGVRSLALLAIENNDKEVAVNHLLKDISQMESHMEGYLNRPVLARRFSF